MTPANDGNVPGAAGSSSTRIHIDRRPYESPNPTTGADLHELAHIPLGHDLFRVVRGNSEDELVAKSRDAVHLTPDEHFYSEEHHHGDVTIIVNGRQRSVHQRKLSFGEVVALAFDNPPTGENVIFTVTYRRGPHQNPEGSMVEGIVVKIKNGMIFNVTATDKS